MEDVFCGHLMLILIAVVVFMYCRKKLAGIAFTSTAMSEELRHQLGSVYEDAIVPSIAVKKMNDIYKLFKIKCPDEIPVS